MAIILASPLSRSPRNEGCGLTRLTMTMPSARHASRSTITGRPPASPIRSTSMEEHTGAPTVASLTPMPASSSACPSPVAPPWLPIAGTTNGSAPA